MIKCRKKIPNCRHHALPAQPAIITSTSSSAATSAEPSTSSSASSSNSFTNFMTQKFFQSRYIYRRLHNVEMYQHHKNTFYTFSKGDTTLEDIRNSFPKVSRIETISNALQSMFMGRLWVALLLSFKICSCPHSQKKIEAY